MRRAMNENPVVQVVLVGLLVLVAGFLLMTRVLTSEEPAATPAESASATGTASGVAPSPEAEEAVADAAASDAAAGAAGADVAAAEAGVPAAAGEFVAGPGLPEPVVAAHESGDTVVLLVTRSTGTDDKKMRAIVGSLRGREGVAVFMTTAKNAAKYARVTEGVDLDRVPALIVVSPPSASKRALPTATVSYAYRGAESVDQAIRDAGYKGPRLPYHPE